MDTKELRESAFRVNRTTDRIIIIRTVDLRNHLRPHRLMTMEITIQIEVEVDQDVVRQEVRQNALRIIRTIVATVTIVLMVMDIVHHKLHRNRQGQFCDLLMSTRDWRSENPKVNPCPWGP